MKLSELALLPGDIILSKNETFVARIIRAFGVLRTGQARTNHASLVISPHHLAESIWHVKVRATKIYDNTPVIVWRNPNLNDHDRELIAAEACKLVGSHYGFLKLFLFALDATFQTDYFTSKFGMQSFKVCSLLVSWSYSVLFGDTPFGTHWKSTAPDTIDDYCHVNNWEVVFCTL